MKFISTLLAVLFICCNVAAQTYPVGSRTITFTDASRNNRGVSTQLFYPAASAGANTALAGGNASFPVVVFGHGFLIGTGSYQWLADSLAKNGYIVALPSTEGGILPSHGQFGNDLSFLSSYITSLNDSATSFLFGRVIRKAAVGGHSMGGGSSFLAAAQNNGSIAALFNFAAAETVPSATNAAASVSVPSLIFSGSGDCIAPPAVQQAMYNGLSCGCCKFYINITGALHCQFANNNAVCATGQLFSGCNNASISNSTVFQKTTSLLLPFLDYYLKGICIRGNVFDNTYNTITGVTKERSCAAFPSCGILPVTLVSFTGMVNNGQAKLSWRTATELNVRNYSVEKSQDGITFNTLSNTAPRGNSGQGADYNATDALPFGGASYYRLKITDNDGSYRYSDVLKLATAVKSFAITALYPNPVADVLTVQLQSDKRQTIDFTITDITGRRMLTQSEVVEKGSASRGIICRSLSAGTYVLEYHAKEDASIHGTFRIIKNK
jgi:dienelactone hydrolase